MQSKAKTVDEYIASLPDERAEAIAVMRKAILKNLPKGFEETMQYGMISYVVPHKIYPSGYHCNPKEALPFISLASQKNHFSLYHMMVYQGALKEWFLKEWKKEASKKLDMGKACIRFKKLDDVPLPLIERLVAKISPKEWIEVYEKTIKK